MLYGYYHLLERGVQLFQHLCVGNVILCLSSIIKFDFPISITNIMFDMTWLFVDKFFHGYKNYNAVYLTLLRYGMQELDKDLPDTWSTKIELGQLIFPN